MDTLTKEIIARAVGDAAVDVLEYKEIDFSKIVKHKCVIIANEIHEVLERYDEAIGNDFDTIEEIVRIFEKYGYSGGNIHDF